MWRRAAGCRMKRVHSWIKASPGLVRGMGLAGDDEAVTGRCGLASMRSRRVEVVQQQIRPLVGREAAPQSPQSGVRFK